MAGGRRSLWVGLTLAVVLFTAWLGQPLLAQNVAEVVPLGRDPAAQTDRYQVTLRPGATLWTVAADFLPLTSLDEGDRAAYQRVWESYQRTFPDRQPDAIRPDDSFTLEVPAGAFVSERVARDGPTIVYRSFRGDLLTFYPRHPTLVYRLVRAEAPDRAEVSLTGQGSSAVLLARELYQVDQPDYIQVRMVRGALNDRNARVIVDLKQKYLDDLRNFRDRAISVEPGDFGVKIYTFSPDDQDVPFVRVEDAIGDQIDPGAFPREFRLAFYRDGTVRRYLVTESGDALAPLARPDSARWQRVLPEIKDWQTGAAEPLTPFTPAVTPAGQVTPGRLLVLGFAPKVAAPTSSATAAVPETSANSGLSCLGVPLAMVLAGLAGAARTRLGG